MPGKLLPRRALLKGIVGLPLLEAMLPARPVAPCRMAFLYVPNGIVMNQWLPGPNARVAQILAPYREDILLLTGLTHNGGRALGDGPGDHGRAGANYLTGVHPKKTNGRDLRAGISVDQVAAQKLEGRTRFSSLELGCEEGVQGGSCDNGYSCAYSNSISWRTPASPMPAEIRPRAVFNRLFGSAESDPWQKSILDVVMSDAKRLNNSLGASDKRKLDEYLFAIRDIEKRLNVAPSPRPSTAINAPGPGIPANFAEHARIMFDLLTLAFQTDSTRVATVLLALEQSPRAYPEIGIPEAHHGLTHHQGDKEKIAKVTEINCYHATQLAYLLNKWKSTPDGDGTLLDHVMLTYGSGLSDGNAHDHSNLPTVLAGKGCGQIKTGRTVNYPLETPMSNLFVAMLDRVGVPVESLGDSNGELKYLSDLS